MDLVTRLRKAFNLKYRTISDNANARLHQLSYVIMATIIILSVIFASQALAGVQLVSELKTEVLFIPIRNSFLPSLPDETLVRACRGNSGNTQVRMAYGSNCWGLLPARVVSYSINLIGLGLVTVTGFFFRRSWCRICRWEG